MRQLIIVFIKKWYMESEFIGKASFLIITVPYVNCFIYMPVKSLTVYSAPKKYMYE